MTALVIPRPYFWVPRLFSLHGIEWGISGSRETGLSSIEHGESGVAVTGGAATTLTFKASNSSTGTNSLTVSGITANGDIYCVVQWRTNTDVDSVTGVTLDGSAMTEIYDTAQINGDADCGFVVYHKNANVSSVSAVVSLTDFVNVTACVYETTGLGTPTSASDTDTQSVTGTSVSFSGLVNPGAGGVTFLGWAHREDPNATTWTNADEDLDVDNGNRQMSHASVLGSHAGTISASHGGASDGIGAAGITFV